MNHIKFFAILSVLVGVACFVGCKPDDGLNDVEGTVTLNGQPLENGYIEMGPMAGQSGTPVGGAITAGKYKIRASEGEMIVGIRAQKTIQLTPEQQTADEKAHNVTERVEDIIPDKYNNRSELKATITKGKNTVDFAITTDDAGGAAE
jgi:hypothetical protein